jgi:dTDP-4-amino-4,6-dideoxygalactose transaminase
MIHDDMSRPPRRNYLVFGAPQILDPEIDEVVATLRSAWIGTGPRVHHFEEAFRSYTRAENAIALHSCTAALHLAMIVLGIKPADEVIVPGMTFAATANAVIHAGGTPVFADVDRGTMCLAPDELDSRLTRRSRAVIPVHFGGRPCDIEGILRVATSRGLGVIEDCAHAIETTVHDRHVGTFGDFGTFSFYATKNVVAGEGGMVLTADADRAARIKRLALHGLSADAWKRFSDEGFRHYEVVEPGFKYNMMDLQAAIAMHQLARAERNLVRRNAIWRRYDAAFANLPVFFPTPPDGGTRHGRHLYTLLVDIDRLTVDRDDIMRDLHRQNVGTGVHYRALHLHPYYSKTFGYRPGDLPNTEWIADRTVSLPLSPGLSDDDVEDVIAAVQRTFQRFARRATVPRDSQRRGTSDDV